MGTILLKRVGSARLLGIPDNQYLTQLDAEFGAAEFVRMPYALRLFTTDYI